MSVNIPEPGVIDEPNGWAKVLTVSRKAATALVGVLAMAAGNNLLPEPWNYVAAAVIAVATYFGVYQVKNVPSEPVGR